MLADLKLRIPSSEHAKWSDALLESYLNQAEMDVRMARNYLDTEETEEKFKFLVIELALWYINTQGVEGEKQHTELSTNRSFRSKGEILSQISSIARAL